MTCGGAFGSVGVGSGAFGAGTVLAVEGVRETRLNALLVTFNVPPLALDRSSVFDALYADNWTLAALSPWGAVVRLAQACARVSALEVEVYLDGILAAPATYALTLNPRVRDALGLPSSGCRSAVFSTFASERVPTVAERATERSDIGNPQTLSDLKRRNPLGTYQINDRGDYANESGRAYLRKRVFRRAMTSLGEFYHLPNYGFAETLKGTITPALLRRMQARAQAQLLREPDVASASVTVQALADAPGIVVVTMLVRDTTGGTDSMTARMDLLNGGV